MQGQVLDITFYKQLRSTGLPLSAAIELLSFATGKPYGEVQRQNLDDILVGPAVASDILAQLAANVPVAYITGRQEFYGHEFIVTRDTLIPRADTETLVSAVLDHVKTCGEENKPLTIVDLYTGSGCILISLLKELPQAQGIGVDISKPALAVAEQNSKLLNVADRCKFIEHDLLRGLPEGLIDGLPLPVVTANPPYVSEAEYKESEPSIFYEPSSALVAVDDGYLHYKLLLKSLSNLGNIDFFMEVGFRQSETVRQYADKFGFVVSSRRDLAGIERVVIGHSR
jgi:release factor glutamine methyltransferase